ncbi:hypothetical protein ACP275_06G031400 [Erythranthe tilingii]
MATPAHRLLQDQNLNLLYNAAATPMGKTNPSKADKKRGLGGRKALNDISNSRNPSMIHSKKKDNPTNAIPVEKDSRVKFSKVTEKGKIGGRKALTDLTNAVKPRVVRKLDTVAEENIPSSVVEERFLHNHQECIKAQMKALDIDHFLNSVGLNNDMPIRLSDKKVLRSSSSRKQLEMEEILEKPFEDRCKKTEVRTCCSPPKSPKPPYMNWEDENFSDLTVVIETPKRPKLL